MKEIIYEDDDVIVCIKEPGVSVQSDLTSDTDLYTRLLDYVKKKADRPYLGLVHRLDRPVGGLIVFGKTPQATAHLSKQLQERTIKKTYLAVVENKPQDMTLTDYLKKKFKGNVSNVVDATVSKAKKAILHLKYLESNELDGNMHSLVSIDLETGRHHQIRVQLSHAGYPIYGDTKYNPTFMSKKGWHQIALYSYRIEFKHPKTRKVLTFEHMPTSEPFNIYDLKKA